MIRIRLDTQTTGSRPLITAVGISSTAAMSRNAAVPGWFINNYYYDYNNY